MAKKRKISLGFGVWLVLAMVLAVGLVLVWQGWLAGPKDVKAGASDNVSGWAYSENLGWFSFNCDNPEVPGSPCPAADYGVHICQNDSDTQGECGAIAAPKAGVMVGRAWARGTTAETGGVGFISFNPSETAGCPALPCQSRVDLTSCVANVCEITGWARALTSGPTGGWDGWIKLKGATNPGGLPYGVTIDFNTNPAEFSGWAWGGDDDGNEIAVIGWLSFNSDNCDLDDNDAVDVACGGDNNPLNWPVYVYNVNVPDDIINLPPEKPANLTETIFSQCAHVSGATPQAALGLQYQFSWLYQDPEAEPMSGFELWLSDNPAELIGDTPPANILNYQAGGLSVASGSVFQTLLFAFPDEEGDVDFTPTGKLAWNTTYHWKVRVKDEGSGAWSAWSDIKTFSQPTPQHAAPQPGFESFPEKPAEDEVVQFCSLINAPDCPENKTKCYLPDDSETPCGAVGATFNWTLPGATYLDGTDNTMANPVVSFSASGIVSAILTVGQDYVCSKDGDLRVTWPIPNWREVAP